MAAFLCWVDPSALNLVGKFRDDSVRCLYALQKDLENGNECDQGSVETDVIRGQHQRVLGVALESVR